MRLSEQIAHHRADILAILEREGFDNPRVFGSTARGEDGPDSDLDLLVQPGAAGGLLAQARAILELERLLDRRVDLITDGALDPALADNIRDDLRPL
jgi:uncharacterized protein